MLHLSIVDDVMQAWYSRGPLNNDSAQVSVSPTGTLAYVPGGVYPEPLTSQVLVDT